MLLHLINRIWIEGKVSSARQETLLVGIPKRNHPSALRPIALSPVINRVAERLIGLRLTNWIERHLKPLQAGVRRRRRTQEHITAMAQITADTLGSKQKCAALFTDFSAAYDRVEIPALLSKMGNDDCPPNLLC